MVLLAAVLMAACGPVGSVQTQPVPPPTPAASYVPGLQTHFGSLIGHETMTALRAKGFVMARIDAQSANDELTLAMVREATEAGLRPLVIVRDAEQLSHLPTGLDYELRNEPDLNGPKPSEYAALAEAAAVLARDRGQRLWVGVVSNLNERGFKYLREIGPLPEGVGVSVHRYGDGTFEDPHDGFATREAEVAALRALIGERPFGVSEFGYPTNKDGWLPFLQTGLSLEQSAARIKQEFEFWARMGASWSVVFQLNDGPTDTREHRYGIRHFDGTWKPSADVLLSTVPSPPPPIPSPEPAPEPAPIPEATVAAIVTNAVTGRPIAGALVISSCDFSGHANGDGYIAWQVSLPDIAPTGEPAVACSFSAHVDGYEDAITDGIWITGNRDVPIALTPRPPPYPFPDESGRLRVDGKRFRTEDGQLWSWRGFSWFLGYRRFLSGEDVQSDLRWMRAHGVNVVRVFGPLPWKETPDYRVETFNLDRLGEFFTLLADHGLRVEFVPVCYGRIDNNRVPEFTLAAQRRFVQRVYDIAQHHWNVFIEITNEPAVNKTDPVAIAKGLQRRGVLTALGAYPKFNEKYSTVKRADYGTVHLPRDASWARKARIAQEIQNSTGIPWVSDEPAKITEPGFQYPGGKNDPKKTPSDAVWHGAIAHLWTPGFTLHTEDGKWGRVPGEGTLQATVATAVLNDVWLKIGPEWQEGAYNGSHMSNSPVHFERDIWAYSSIRGGEALSVRVDEKPSEPVHGWRIKGERWGPSNSLTFLERAN